MVSVVIIAEPPFAPVDVRADFTRSGFDVVSCADSSEGLIQSVIRDMPDVVVAFSASPGDVLLDFAAMIKKLAPCPFLLFTNDASPSRIERATVAGVHGYVVDGYAPKRLRSLAQVVTTRFRHERSQGEKLDDLARDLRDRKQVDSAKGLLMRSRGLGEAAAFELMRKLAMQRRLRLVHVAESVIALSVGAEAVNRSGQIRMLAQRLARCLVQLSYGVHAEWATANLRDCRERIEANIAQLHRTVADRGCAPDIARIAAAWEALQQAAVSQTDLASIDALADALTREAETLTDFLESSGLVTKLRIINLAGRQRMLSQRVGKLCLLLALDDKADPATVAARAASLQESTAAFQDALAELDRMPVHTPEIDRRLAEARRQWAAMTPFGRGQGAMPRCIEVCEGLLEAMEALTAAYEQAAQVLIGDRVDTFTEAAS